MKQDLLHRVLDLKPIKPLVELSRIIVLPGFDGVPLYGVTSFFFKGISKGSLTSRASAIAFNFFLAIFPAIIFFFTVIPYLPVKDFEKTMMDLLHEILPENAFRTVQSTVLDIIRRPRGGLLSIGFLLALYFSTNGVNSIIEAFNMTVHARDTRPVIKQRLIAIFLVIILTSLTIIAISLITSGTFFLKYLVKLHVIKNWLFYDLITIVKWVIVTSLFFFTISFLYYFAPCKDLKFRFISAGSSLATVLTMLTSIGFDYYVSNFSKYNALYGSIGTLLIILLWIYFNSISLLLGFELNASIINARLDKNRPVKL